MNCPDCLPGIACVACKFAGRDPPPRRPYAGRRAPYLWARGRDPELDEEDDGDDTPPAQREGVHHPAGLNRAARALRGDRS